MPSRCLPEMDFDGLVDITPKDTVQITIKKRQPMNPNGNFLIAIIHFFNMFFINNAPFLREYTKKRQKHAFSLRFFKNDNIPEVLGEDYRFHLL